MSPGQCRRARRRRRWELQYPVENSGCHNSICTIKLGSSQLPPLTATNTVINGYWQFNIRPSRLADGDDAVITVVLDGGDEQLRWHRDLRRK